MASDNAAATPPTMAVAPPSFSGAELDQLESSIEAKLQKKMEERRASRTAIEATDSSQQCPWAACRFRVMRQAGKYPIPSVPVHLLREAGSPRVV